MREQKQERARNERKGPGGSGKRKRKRQSTKSVLRMHALFHTRILSRMRARARALTQYLSRAHFRSHTQSRSGTLSRSYALSLARASFLSPSSLPPSLSPHRSYTPSCKTSHQNHGQSHLNFPCSRRTHGYVQTRQETARHLPPKHSLWRGMCKIAAPSQRFLFRCVCLCVAVYIRHIRLNVFIDVRS